MQSPITTKLDQERRRHADNLPNNFRSKKGDEEESEHVLLISVMERAVK